MTAVDYDETNNVRRLRLTPEGFNIRSPDCFVLGGIVHRGTARALGIVAGTRGGC